MARRPDTRKHRKRLPKPRPLTPPWTDAAVLRAIGLALFGPQWQRPLARRLGVTPRRIVQWLADDRVSLVRRRQIVRVAIGLWPHRRVELEQTLAAGETALTVTRAWSTPRPEDARRKTPAAFSTGQRLRPYHHALRIASHPIQQPDLP